MKNENFEIIKMINPPMTEDGFLNPAFESELQGIIKEAFSAPTYQRLADNKEWNKKVWTFRREITGYFAHSAIRLIGNKDETPFPPKLEGVIGLLHVMLKPYFDENDMAELSLCDINQLLHEILMPEQMFLDWNDEDKLHGWIDLDALLHQVCINIRDERRSFDEFNRRFDTENPMVKE